RAVLEKFSVVQMIDVHLPTTDGRTVIMSRYTRPEPELQILLQQLRLSFPKQPPPRMVGKADVNKQNVVKLPAYKAGHPAWLREDFLETPLDIKGLLIDISFESAK
ncbi:MAG: hypothetical protein NTX36_15655, partial [Proteobacteria bacterium]|nr:hypothetical protein [Pseudomonadota bacterium]